MPARPGGVAIGDSAPMNLVHSSPKGPLGDESQEPVMTIQDELQLQQSLHLREVWLLPGDLHSKIKRSMDVVGALLGLLLLAPLMLAISLLIRLETPGPVLFRQLRRGYRGQL